MGLIGKVSVQMMEWQSPWAHDMIYQNIYLSAARSWYKQ